MKNLILISFVSILLFLSACNSSQTPESTIADIPELLDRPELVQNGKEWENVHNAYTTAKAQLMAKPNEVEPYLKLAEVFILEARVTGEHGHYYPAALQVINDALAKTKEPNDLRFRALSMKAAVMLSQHEFEKALICGKEALKINAHNAQIYGVMTDALVEMGRYEDAVAMADKMISIRPDLRSYSRVSYLREIHGDVDGAIEAMEMAVSAAFPGYEQSAWTRLTLGNIYQTYGNLSKAAKQYHATLAERENYPFAIGALAEVEMEKGNLAKAEELLNEAKAIIPEVGFYIQLAEIYKETDRTEQFDEIMKEVFAMLQDDVDSGHNMNMEYADLHLNLTKDYDKAMAFAKKEYLARPDNIDVNRMLAAINMKMNNFDKAQQHLAMAERTNSKHPELLEIKKLLAQK